MELDVSHLLRRWDVKRRRRKWRGGKLDKKKSAIYKKLTWSKNMRKKKEKIHKATNK